MSKRKEVNILIDSRAYNFLKTRAQKNFITVSELISEILRRSIVSYKKNKQTSSGKSDDKFIEYFSRRR
ncbi:hypothetical protein J4409_00890 [Candidatus Woesearchaeota archaeon]|nr:hypothetical protein [Candidatus Woesearchaeota archaeon]